MTNIQPCLSSNKSNWETPNSLFQKYNIIYNFTIDAAADQFNHKVTRYFGPGGEQPCGLEASWENERVWLNPPYGRNSTGLWIKRACKRDAIVAVVLIPSRTDTKWFHKFLYKQKGINIEFLEGRVKFVGAEHGAPFPSMIVTVRKE